MMRIMSIFDDRERAFEAEWANRAEQRLRLRARRNRLLAEWAADQEGLTGDARAARIRELVKRDFEPEGEAALFDAVAQALGRDPSDIAARAAELEAEAAAQLSAQGMSRPPPD